MYDVSFPEFNLPRKFGALRSVQHLKRACQVSVRHASGGVVSLWRRKKTHGDKWRYGFSQLPAAQPCDSYVVVFEAMRGASYRSDVAIDDISVRPGGCPSYG